MLLFSFSSFQNIYQNIYCSSTLSSSVNLFVLYFSSVTVDDCSTIVSDCSVSCSFRDISSTGVEAT